MYYTLCNKQTGVIAADLSEIYCLSSAGWSPNRGNRVSKVARNQVLIATQLSRSVSVSQMQMEIRVQWRINCVTQLWRDEDWE